MRASLVSRRSLESPDTRGSDSARSLPNLRSGVAGRVRQFGSSSIQISLRRKKGSVDGGS
jgi:hypothetical protein